MKIDSPLWFKILLLIMLMMYVVTFIPFIVATKSVTFYIGVFGLLFFICYFMIINAIVQMLLGNKRGYYMFLFFQALIPIIYLLEGSNFSLEQAILRPVIFCSLVYLGINSKT